MKQQWRISTLSFTNFVLFAFLVGFVVSPFTGNCRGKELVFAAGENPLLKSKSVASALDLQNALREIYQEVSPAVVRIETEQTVKVQMHPFFNDPTFRRFFGVPDQQQEQKRQGLGSGFIVSPDGFIVTNDHVVAHVDKITVKLQNGESHEAKLVGSDRISDIALLKIDGVKNLRTVHLGNSDDLMVGDFGIAIGNPFGLQSTFTLGVISSTGQDIDAADGVPRIQTDAAINPGNSGGPLLNIQGEVVGINQMIYSQSGGSVGIGFAIPINYAKMVIESLKSGKKMVPGYIGVNINTNPPEELISKLGIKGKEGILVQDVEVGGPAWEGGLRPFDYITHVDDHPAEKFSVLRSTVIRKGPGSEVVIRYIRDKKEHEAKIKVGKLPTAQGQ